MGTWAPACPSEAGEAFQVHKDEGRCKGVLPGQEGPCGPGTQDVKATGTGKEEA